MSMTLQRYYFFSKSQPVVLSDTPVFIFYAGAKMLNFDKSQPLTPNVNVLTYVYGTAKIIQLVVSAKSFM